MKSKLSLLLSAYIIGMSLLSVNVKALPQLAYAVDEIDKLEHEKQERLDAKEDLLIQATETEKEKAELSAQLEKFKKDLIASQNDLQLKNQLLLELANNKVLKQKLYEDTLMTKQKLMRTMYKGVQFSPLEIFLGSENFSDYSHTSNYFDRVIDEIHRQGTEIQGLLADLSQIITQEEKEKARLAVEAENLKNQTVETDKKVQEIATDLKNINSQIATLEGEIENITAEQEALIRSKLSATQLFTTVGDSEQGAQELPDPGFSPAYAAFSYGYPHRVGMSQYGAYGRAKAGQDYITILKAYYKDVSVEDMDGQPEEIEVTGVGSLNFEEEYLMGIAEMPASWANDGGMEALKAQAVAARTYALSYTNNGQGAICATQSCQVYLKSKAESDSAKAWHDAVEATKGMVIVNGGKPIKAWYASTAGGYTRLPTDFDVKWNSTPGYIKRIRDTDGGGKPYEGPSYADSPWFHKAWYSNADGHPWLTEEEMDDLLNAAQLSDDQNEHLSHPDNGGWSYEEVEEKVTEDGNDIIKDISSIKPIFSTEGYTSSLVVKHAGGTTEVDGQRFRKVFVLRSRGNLALWSSLYDIEVQ